MIFSKWNIEQAIEYLQDTIKEKDQINALNVLIWNYRSSEESKRLLSETLKEMKSQ
tara:strand:+ start:152 stop:319 length:168 start_codon:yes stop_codon:yes gene_type:complete